MPSVEAWAGEGVDTESGTACWWQSTWPHPSGCTSIEPSTERGRQRLRVGRSTEQAARKQQKIEPSPDHTLRIEPLLGCTLKKTGPPPGRMQPKTEQLPECTLHR